MQYSGFLSAVLDQTALQLGNLRLSVLQIGASILVLAVSGLAIVTILILVNQDAIAYYKEKWNESEKASRKVAREKAYKAHMKRVRRYEAHLREERGY